MLIGKRCPALVVLVACSCVGSGRITSAQSPNPQQLEQLGKDGQRALAAGRYDEAQAAYEQLRKQSPGTAEVHAQLGLIYFQQGKFSEAVPALREAIRLKPTLPRLDTLLAMSLSELGQFAEALPALEKAFRHSADPVVKRMAGLHLQRTYTGLARDNDAVEVALQLSRLLPDDPEVLYHSGRLFANLAYLQTMRLSRVAPDSVWMHQAAGEANESQGLYDAAVEDYRRVLAIAPRRPGVHFRIGRALQSKAQGTSDATAASAAFPEFEQELQIDPTNANAAYEIAELHRKAGRLDAAREFFERALKYYPDLEDALVGLGRTLLVLGKPDLAVTPLRAAIARNPANDVAHYQLAQVYGALGQSAEQAKALAEFTRLRDQASSQSSPEADARRDVTRQTLETRPPH